MAPNPPPTPRLLAEETVRPVSAIVPLILWGVAVVATVSVIMPFFEPIPEFVPDWMHCDDDVNVVAVIFIPLITLTLATVFTLSFFMYRGVRYRIFTDRVEYQQGTCLHLVPFQRMSFGEWQTLAFSEVDSICWQPESDGVARTFIEFHSASHTLQLHKGFDMSGHVAEACKTIERDMIAPKNLLSLEAGETITFSTIRFSKGQVSRRANFFAQSRIHIEDTSGGIIEFDMPNHNPHALWAVIMARCSPSVVQVLDFPQKEKNV